MICLITFSVERLSIVALDYLTMFAIDSIASVGELVIPVFISRMSSGKNYWMYSDFVRAASVQNILSWTSSYMLLFYCNTLI